MRRIQLCPAFFVWTLFGFFSLKTRKKSKPKRHNTNGYTSTKNSVHGLGSVVALSVCYLCVCLHWWSKPATLAQVRSNMSKFGQAVLEIWHSVFMDSGNFLTFDAYLDILKDKVWIPSMIENQQSFTNIHTFMFKRRNTRNTCRTRNGGHLSPVCKTWFLGKLEEELIANFQIGITSVKLTQKADLFPKGMPLGFTLLAQACVEISGRIIPHRNYQNGSIIMDTILACNMDVYVGSIYALLNGLSTSCPAHPSHH